MASEAWCHEMIRFYYAIRRLAQFIRRAAERWHERNWLPEENGPHDECRHAIAQSPVS
jgi:hypothetical protein